MRVRILYRARQFWHTLAANPTSEDYKKVSQVLSADLINLFSTLQRSEQVHGLWIFRKLLEQGETHPDLLAAALLHDVGKNRFPLRLWQRVVIVLGGKFFPEKVKHWREDDPQGWRCPFVVAERHAAWGAKMAMRAGASETTLKLIERHQDSLMNPIIYPEDQLLYRLQFFDDRG
jgi:hypothetical protein